MDNEKKQQASSSDIVALNDDELSAVTGGVVGGPTNPLVDVDQKSYIKRHGFLWHEKTRVKENKYTYRDGTIHKEVVEMKIK
jgi:hypothetical protein